MVASAALADSSTLPAAATPYVMLFAGAEVFARRSTQSTWGSFRLELVASVEMAKRFIDTKPYDAIVVWTDRSSDAVDVLTCASRIVPRTPTLLVCTLDQLEALARDLPGRQEIVLGDERELQRRVHARLAARRPAFAYERSFPARLAAHDETVGVACVGLAAEHIALIAPLEHARTLVPGRCALFQALLPVTDKELALPCRIESLALEKDAGVAKLGIFVAPRGEPRFRALERYLGELERGVVCVVADGASGGPLVDVMPRYCTVRPATLVELERCVPHADVLVVISEPPRAWAEAIAVRLHHAPHVRVVLLAVGGERTWRPPEASIAYETQAMLSAADLERIVSGIFTARAQRLVRSSKAVSANALRLTALLEASRAVTLQSTPGAAATTAAEKLETLLSADRALCYYVAGQPDRLVIADRRHDLDAEHPAHRGLCGFVARAGTLVQASPARSDPRYVQALDNPLGREDDHLLLVPIVGEDGRVFGVLAAARASNRVGFSEDEIEVATTFALHVVSIFRELDLRSRVNEVIHDRGRHFRGQAAQLFRLEAIEHSEQGRRYGDLLELDDRWSTWGKYVLVSLFIFLPFALSVARVHDTATGPAIIRGERAEEVVAPVDGMVADVLVEEGERVTVGQPLLQLATQEELAELRRAESEWKGLLLRRLEDPRDSAAQQRLVAVRAELQRAREIVHMRTIAARQDGVVRAIPRKPGELVRQGTVVASIQATDAGGFVEATISSNFRPLVQEGIWLDVELSDFQTAHVLLQVSEISEQALGPNEVRQLLWSEDQDSPATSPRLLLRAPLTTDTFEYDGEHFRLREGMTGVARVRLRSKPAIFKLLPALEEAFGD